MNCINLLEPANGTQTAELHAVELDAGRTMQSGDRSMPRQVDFSWEPVLLESVVATYDLALSTDRHLNEPFLVPGMTEPRHGMENLKIGTEYFWQVIARAGDAVIARSPIWSFKTHPAPPRLIHVPGITNVRDVGGWPLPAHRVIRQGMVYRSSEMNSHLEIKPEGRRILTDVLGIRTDIDLRGADEDARPVLDPAKVRWINIPVRPYAAIIEDSYADKYRQLFGVFADPGAYPVLFHCWGGCDRGGTVAFLLGALLGSGMENLAADYELSSLSIWTGYSRMSDIFQSLLGVLRPYGDDINSQVENYLRSVGVTAGEISAIRGILVAEAY